MAGVQPTGFLAKRKTTKKDACFGTFSPILDKEQGGYEGKSMVLLYERTHITFCPC